MTEQTVARGLEGIIVAETTLCFVDGQEGKLYYAGYSIDDLAENCCFEEVAHLLWHGHLPTRVQLDELKHTLVQNRALPDATLQMLSELPPDTHPIVALRTAASHLGAFDPEADDHSLESNYLKSVRLTALFPTIVAAFERLREGKEPVPPRDDLDHAANLLYMLHGEEPHNDDARVLDVSLILHMEHGLNASAFAACVTISTLSDLYSAITSGIGTLKGPLHGGANEQVIKTLQQIGSVEAVEPYVQEVLSRHERIMGFGHRVYKVYDPRARILKRYAELLAERAGERLWYDMSVKMEEVVVDRLGDKGIYPNVDFYSATVYKTLEIPLDLFIAMFATSRVVGWTAHVLEQLKDNRLIRPRAKYIGELDRPFVPIDER